MWPCESGHRSAARAVLQPGRRVMELLKGCFPVTHTVVWTRTSVNGNVNSCVASRTPERKQPVVPLACSQDPCYALCSTQAVRRDLIVFPETEAMRGTGVQTAASSDISAAACINLDDNNALQNVLVGARDCCALVAWACCARQ